LLVHHLLKIDQLANRPVHDQATILLCHDPRAVIAPVFEAFQRIKKRSTASGKTDRPNNSAHALPHCFQIAAMFPA
jgi:hypothetical protein